MIKNVIGTRNPMVSAIQKLGKKLVQTADNSESITNETRESRRSSAKNIADQSVTFACFLIVFITKYKSV